MKLGVSQAAFGCTFTLALLLQVFNLSPLWDHFGITAASPPLSEAVSEGSAQSLLCWQGQLEAAHLGSHGTGR